MKRCFFQHSFRKLFILSGFGLFASFATEQPLYAVFNPSYFSLITPSENVCRQSLGRLGLPTPYAAEATRFLDTLSAQLEELEMKKPEIVAAMYSKPETSTLLALRPMYQKVLAAVKELDTAHLLQSDPHLNGEAEPLVREARETLMNELRWLRAQLLDLFIPAPENECLVEISTNAGSSSTPDSGLIGQLSDLYGKYAEQLGLASQVIDSELNDRGGIKKLIIRFSGKRAMRAFLYESGVHRIETRVKTQKFTVHLNVNVLPVLSQQLTSHPDSEFEVTGVHSGGNGGQNVNKVSSAADVKHKPTGLRVKISTQRDFHANKAQALELLRARLQALEQERIHGRSLETRRGQTGVISRDQARIRNYDLESSGTFSDQRFGRVRGSIPERDLTRLDLLSLVHQIQDQDLARAMNEKSAQAASVILSP